MSSVYVVRWIFLQTFQTYFCLQANSVDPDQTAPRWLVAVGCVSLCCCSRLELSNDIYSAWNLRSYCCLFSVLRSYLATSCNINQSCHSRRLALVLTRHLLAFSSAHLGMLLWPFRLLSTVHPIRWLVGFRVFIFQPYMYVASGMPNFLVTVDLDFPFLTWLMMSILSLMLNCFLFLEFSGMFIADIFP